MYLDQFGKRPKKIKRMTIRNKKKKKRKKHVFRQIWGMTKNK